MFVAFGINMQCACVILSSVTCPAVLYFFNIFLEMAGMSKKIFNIQSFDFLYNFCLKHILFLEEMSEITENCFWFSRKKCRLFLSDFG